MRSFSKRRMVLFVVLLAAVGVGLAAENLFGQATGGGAGGTGGAAGGATTVGQERSTFFSVLKESFDFVSIIILLASIMGVALIIQGFIKTRRSVMMPETSSNHIRELISQRQFKELIEFTETDPSFVSSALNPALKRAPSFSAMKEAMETAIGEKTAEEFRKIEFLNIIGNLGPLLGLMGTVLGMIHAFMEMKNAGGEANPAVLSGGISKALAHTFLGLALAIPCLACFGILRTMVDRLTVSGALEAEELLLMIKPAEAKPAAGAAIRAAAAPHPAAAPMRKPPIPAPPVVPAQG